MKGIAKGEESGGKGEGRKGRERKESRKTFPAIPAYAPATRQSCSSSLLVHILRSRLYMFTQNEEFKWRHQVSKAIVWPICRANSETVRDRICL